MRVRLTSKSGETFYVSPPRATKGIPSCFVFSYAKAGSTLLEQMIAAYCGKKRVSTFSLFDAAFGQGIPTQNIQADALDCFQDFGCIYTGFRHYPSFNLPTKNANNILLVRDPRDMLVSMYYSLLKSHKIPEGLEHMRRNRDRASKLDIDEFVLQHAPNYLKQFKAYQQGLGGSHLHNFRYEDVIYSKKDWLEQIVEILEIPKDKRLISVISQRFDLIPEAEDESAHIRQVHPGNYLSKLSTDTIKSLNGVLSPFLSEYDYANN